MTRFGKALVFINLALSLVLAGWAFSAYSNRPDWVKAGKPSGRLADRQKEIQQLQTALSTATAGRQEVRTALLTQETKLLADRDWYHRQLQKLHNGPDPTDRTPIQTLVLVKGLPVPDPKNQNRPRMNTDLRMNADRAGQPLQGMSAYDQELDTKRKEVSDVLKKYDELVKRDSALTEELTGDKMKGIKGLHQRLEDEKTKNQGVIAELRLVKPRLVNTVVEGQLILNRKKQLEGRIDELKKGGVGVAAAGAR
jgi:hypothetical protein